MTETEPPELWLCFVNLSGFSAEPVRLLRVSDDEAAYLNDDDDPEPQIWWSEDGEDSAAGPGLNQQPRYTNFVTDSRTESACLDLWSAVRGPSDSRMGDERPVVTPAKPASRPETAQHGTQGAPRHPMQGTDAHGATEGDG